MFLLLCLVGENFYLLDAIDRKIQMIVSIGLVDFFQTIDQIFLNSHDDNYPRILPTRQLLECFQILIFGSAVSILVFLYELMA